MKKLLLLSLTVLLFSCGDNDGKTIFFDWAIQVPETVDPAAHIAFCISHYGAGQPDHPMTAVLEAALAPAPKKIRRGGRAARITPEGQRRDGQFV